MHLTLEDLKVTRPDTSSTFWTVVTSTANERKRTKNAYRVIEAGRNGSTQRWKTRPTEFRIPAKYGFNETFQIWHYTHGWTDVQSDAQSVCNRLNEQDKQDSAIDDAWAQLVFVADHSNEQES